MKNERISELFSANIDRLYAAAKEKHGERAEEALVDAVRKTAGKFKKLGEKAYITALLQEMGVSAFYQNEEPAPGGLVAAMESAFAEGFANAKKKNRLFALLGCAAAVVCVAVAVGFALRPGAAPSGATTIEGAKELTSGDFVLSNVHTINDYTGFDGEFGLSVKNENKYQSSSTVAPDGTVYLLTVCETNVETQTDTIGLYQMTDDGWEKLCEFDQKFAIKQEMTYTRRYSARNFVFCDGESRPFVFLYDMVDETLAAYKYSHASKRAEKIAAVSIKIASQSSLGTNIVSCIDGKTVFFACSNGSTYIDFLAYDFGSNEFQQGGEFVTGSNIFLNSIAHKNDYTYLLVADHGGTCDAVYLYGYKNLAENTQELIFEKQLFEGGFNSLSRRFDGGAVITDATGKVYTFFTSAKDQMSEPEYILEIVSPEGESLISKRYKALQYPGDQRSTGSRGIFMGADGTLFFIEDYEQSSIQKITVGAITGEAYDEIKEVASFNAMKTAVLLQPQYISDSTSEEGLFVDLLGACLESASMQHGYMRLRLK